MRTHFASKWYCGLSGCFPGYSHHKNDVSLSPCCHRNWFHQCLNLPGKFAYMMSCRKRKLNCLKVNRFYWLLLIETRLLILHQRYAGIPKAGLLFCSLILTLSLSHKNGIQLKKQMRATRGVCCWSQVLNSFSARSITVFWRDGPVQKGLCLASLTAGSDTNPPFGILASIASSGTPKSLLHIAYSFILSTCFHAIAEVLYALLTFSLFSFILSSQTGLAFWGHPYSFMCK